MPHIQYCDLPNRESGKSLAQIQKGDSLEVDLLEIDDLFEFHARLNQALERLNSQKITIEYKRHPHFTRFYQIIKF
jgi:hypothetical protein